MKRILSEQAWEDYLHGQKTDKKVVQRITGLIKGLPERHTPARDNLNH